MANRVPQVRHTFWRNGTSSMESPQQRRLPPGRTNDSVAQLTATASDVPWRVRGGHEGPEVQSGPSPLPCLLSLLDPHDRDAGGRGRCRTHGRADAPTGPCKTAPTRFRTSAHRQHRVRDQEPERNDPAREVQISTLLRGERHLERPEPLPIAASQRTPRVNLLRAGPVRPACPPTPRKAGGGPRSRAHAAMHSTAAVRHRRTQTRRLPPGLCTTPRCLREITGRVAVFQPPAPLRMGFIVHSCHLSPLCASPGAPDQRRPPAHQSRR